MIAIKQTSLVLIFISMLLMTATVHAQLGGGGGGGGESFEVSISGPTSVDVNQTASYSVFVLSSDGVSHTSTTYSIYGGTKLSESKTQVSVRWTSSGSNRYVRATVNTNVGSQTQTRYVAVNSPPPPPPPPPPRPSTPTVSTNTCGNKTFYRGNPPSGVRWYWQATSGQRTTSYGYAPSYPATTSTTMYLRAYNTSTGVWSTSASSASATVYHYPSTPSTPSMTDNCGSSTLTRGNPPSGYTWYWQGTNSNGYSTTNSSATYPVSEDGTYYIRAKNNGANCWSSSRAVSVTVNKYPSTPSTPGVSTNTCGNKTLTKGSAPGGITWYWQGTNSNGTSINSTAAASTYAASIPGTNTYYLRARNNTTHCWSSSRGVSVTVNEIPSTPSTASVTDNCGSSTLTRGNPPSGFTWYWQGTNANGQSTTNSSATYSVTEDGTYYLRAKNNGADCWSSSLAVSVTVKKIPGLASGNDNSRCGEGSVTLTANPGANGDDIRWYSAATGGTLLHTGNSYAISDLSITTTYYAASYNTSTLCEDPDRAPVTAMVNSLPAVYAVTGGGTICQGDGTAIGLSGSETGVDYELFRAGEPITSLSGTGAALDFGLQADEGTYSVEARNASAACQISMSGGAVITFSVASVPTIQPITYALDGATITRDSPPAGEGWYWQSSEAGTDTTNTSTTYLATTGGDHYLRSRNTNGCWNTKIITINANEPTGQTALAATSDAIQLSWTGTGNETGYTIYRSTVETGPFTEVQTLPGTATSYTDQGLSSMTTYYYKVQSEVNAEQSAALQTLTATTEPDCGVPSITGFTIEATTIEVFWDDSFVDVEDYIVEYRLGFSGAWDQNTSTSSPLTLTGLNPGSDYQIRIKSVCNGEVSDPSPTSSKITLNNASCGVPIISANVLGPREIEVSWDDSFTEAENYIIEYRLGSSGAWTQEQSTYSPLTITGLNPESQYQLRAKSICTGIPTAYSSTLNENTLFDPEPDPLPVNTDLSHTALYNGNISAIRWKGVNDEEEQVFAYSYDGLNRLKSAQYAAKSGVTYTANQGHYSVPNIRYDLNGNIMALTRQGMNTNSNEDIIDELAYDYGVGATQSNLLLSVTDGRGSAGFKDGTNAGDDYAYDANGNMTQDLNKEITNISYNHLNLPEVVAFQNGDRIEYLYDAAGIKLQQEVYEEGQLKKITDYVGQYIYETGESGGRKLQLIQHEEGRIVPLEGDTGGDGYDYQYHLKDHLGNVQVTFSITPENYERTATFEDANVVAEGEEFGNVDVSRVSHPSATNTGMAARLNNQTPAGPYAVIGVNKGDTLHLSVNGYYEGGSGYSNPIGEAAMIDALSNSLAGAPMLEGIPTAAIDNGIGSAITLLGVGGSTDDDVPGAYLNFLFFDEEMNLVYDELGNPFAGFVQISTAANFNEEMIEIRDIIAEQEGIVIAYLSNESNSANFVHFDDFTVYHGKTNVVQSDDYYPFGLTFNSYQRTAAEPNRFKYNSFEFMDDLNLNLYDYQARYYDPVIGRFIQVDPAADLMRRHSPYNYAFDNPIRFVDPDGMMPQEGEQEPKKKEYGNNTVDQVDKFVDEAGQAVVDFFASVYKGIQEMILPDSEVEGEGETQKGGIPVTGGAGGPGSSPTKTTASENEEDPIDGTLPSGTAGKFSSPGNVPKAVAETVNKVKDIPGLSGAGSNLEGTGVGNSGTSYPLFKNNDRVFVRRKRAFTLGGRIEMDSTFRIIGSDSTYTERWLLKTEDGSYVDEKIKP